MPLRQIEVPQFGRRLSNIMACPSSAVAESHLPGLELFHKLGGNCIHLHGEGGETHSRTATGEWLARRKVRSDFFLCTQICHEGWDPVAERAIERCTAVAVEEDISTDLELLGIEYLDLVYIANPPRSTEAIVDAIAREVTLGRVHFFGVRNWTEAQIRIFQREATRRGAPGISALVTTELALPAATCPLWPQDTPFAQLEEVVREFGLLVLSHSDGWNRGQFLFEESENPVNPRWKQRWDTPSNRQLAQHIRQLASRRGFTPTELSLAWLFNRSFHSIGLLGLPELLSIPSEQLERASQMALPEDELSPLNPPKTAPPAH
jgi:aryl-alcohol dehydrogenase-like predicted oxidoreductase